MTDDKKPLPRKFQLSKMSLFLGVCCIVAIGVGVYFFSKYQAAETAKNENAQLIEKISQVVQLPNETPMAVSVADKDKLSNKQLASKVENGDVMLIFAKAKRLIVYRPTVEKVVDILSFGSESDIPKQ